MDGTLRQSRRQRFHQHLPAQSVLPEIRRQARRPRPFVVNQHRNGLLTPWGYNATQNVPQLTIGDYVSSRYMLNPLRLWDCDRPVNASTAYLFATAERARDMRQAPVYVLNNSQHNFRKRSTREDLDEIEDWTDSAARRMYEGAGLGPNGVDIFSPYDGYALMAQFFREGFQWHGVKRGDAFAFYAGDIRVEGRRPCWIRSVSGRCNNRAIAIDGFSLSPATRALRAGNCDLAGTKQ